MEEKQARQELEQALERLCPKTEKPPRYDVEMPKPLQVQDTRFDLWRKKK